MTSSPQQTLRLSAYQRRPQTPRERQEVDPAPASTNRFDYVDSIIAADGRRLRPQKATSRSSVASSYIATSCTRYMLAQIEYLNTATSHREIFRHHQTCNHERENGCVANSVFSTS
jgi:hypothetical protein